MSDYSLKYVTEKDIRNFFTPPLDYSDISRAELLIKAEAVEKFVEDVYGLTSVTDVRLPCLLLIAAKVIHAPSLAKKYLTLSEEQLGDYRYVLAGTSIRSDTNSNPFAISLTWESMALQMLNAKTTNKWSVYKVND